MVAKFYILLLCVAFLCSEHAIAQTDSSRIRIVSADSVHVKKTDSIKRHDPKVATFRSAVLPGWGQAYNKKYWKIPIIYAALGTTVGVFIYNLKTYKTLRQAYIYKTDTIASNDVLIDKQFVMLSGESIRTYRNSFRQNIDYTVLVFLLLWGINVVDATVDAHLKEFDVSDNISMKIKPGKSTVANATGINFVFTLHNRRK